jgi:hypothetical protein
MTAHADQVAPRSVERSYNPAYDNYKKLLSILQKSSNQSEANEESPAPTESEKKDF